MPDLPQPEAILSKPTKAGAPLGTVPVNRRPSSQPELVGQRFGSVIIISPDVVWLGAKARRFMHVLCECVTCGYRSVISHANLVGGRSKGCKDCNRPRRYPDWLGNRVRAMRSRCRAPTNRLYPLYGGRGIQFRFASTTEACLWIVEALGIEGRQPFHLDRINNDGHYEAGNLRWATPAENTLNRRNTVDGTALLHSFRLDYPDVHYADSTIRRLHYAGMSNQEIAARFARPSCKPKGVYGTFSTPDREIASRVRGC